MRRNDREPVSGKYIKFDPNAINNYNMFLSNMEQAKDTTGILRKKVMMVKEAKSYQAAKDILKGQFGVFQSELVIKEEDTTCKIFVKQNYIKVTYKSPTEVICLNIQRNTNNTND